ncbi:formate dehydrogenase [Azospirillum thermophilum]|uniref:Formate dehydrogenase n=1 Tax=Azospirillum thermophilum TaxID=2202148 RepID=A0A2S2CQE9_9PROT|nr:formate dehydrogenase [Azospirillum thermophilum]AWK86753.1 formate dehydrogenase [Azospirillum thermophilum]
MTEKNKTTTGASLGRRELFRAAGIGVGALGAAVAGLPAATTEAAAAETVTSQGYRETDHVRKVYELSRF